MLPAEIIAIACLSNTKKAISVFVLFEKDRYRDGYRLINGMIMPMKKDSRFELF